MGIVDQNTEIQSTQVNTIRNYYQLHAKLYQATRWSFLFGRKRLIKALDISQFSDQTILEVGCGTGHNLSVLANQYPNLNLIGVDISPDMLKVASKRLKRHSGRVELIEKPYTHGNWNLPVKPDIIIFSYCLTMINPGWKDALKRAYDDLNESGQIAIVDFHDSPHGFFHRWMYKNHVRMDNHLLPVLKKYFKPIQLEVAHAYDDLWSYFLFIGKK